MEAKRHQKITLPQNIKAYHSKMISIQANRVIKKEHMHLYYKIIWAKKYAISTFGNIEDVRMQHAISHDMQLTK